MMVKSEGGRPTKRRKTSAGGGAAWARPLFVHDGGRVVRFEAPEGSSAKGEFVKCMVCHALVSFNKGSWTTPRQHLIRHNIRDSAQVESLLLVAQQCWEEGRTVPAEKLPPPPEGTSGHGIDPRNRKITDYNPAGGLRTHLPGSLAHARVKRAISLWIATTCLPYATVDTPAFIAMVRSLDAQAPKIGRRAITSEVSARSIAFLSSLCVNGFLLFLHLTRLLDGYFLENGLALMPVYCAATCRYLACITQACRTS